MRLNVEKAKQLNLWPIRVWDASGVKIDRLITECDTESGWVKFFVKDKLGVVRFENNELVEAEEMFPAPLMIEVAPDVVHVDD